MDALNEYLHANPLERWAARTTGLLRALWGELPSETAQAHIAMLRIHVAALRQLLSAPETPERTAVLEHGRLALWALDQLAAYLQGKATAPSREHALIYGVFLQLSSASPHRYAQRALGIVTDAVAPEPARHGGSSASTASAEGERSDRAAIPDDLAEIRPYLAADMPDSWLAHWRELAQGLRGETSVALAQVHLSVLAEAIDRLDEFLISRGARSSHGMDEGIELLRQAIEALRVFLDRGRPDADRDQALLFGLYLRLSIAQLFRYAHGETDAPPHPALQGDLPRRDSQAAEPSSPTDPALPR